MSGQVGQQVIGLRVQRTLPGTPEEVFEAYTNPRMQVQWLSALGPEAGEVQTTVDLRVGGKWEARFRPNETTEVHDVQTYRQIEHPHRLTTDLYAEAIVDGQQMPIMESRIVVEFASDDTGNGTVVTVEQSGFADTATRDMFAGIWPPDLERLGKVVVAVRTQRGVGTGQ